MARAIDGDELLGIERLLDTDAIRKSKTASWLLDQVLHDIQASPTIDPETLPIVRQLREQLERVMKERDAALGRKVYVTARYDGDELTVYRHDAESLNHSRCVVMVKYTAAAANVGYSENGKDGPYKTVMNVDEFGVLTMANDVARALFGYAESKEDRP